MLFSRSFAERVKRDNIRPGNAVGFIGAAVWGAIIIGAVRRCCGRVRCGIGDVFVIGLIERSGGMEGKLPEFDIAIEQINAAGGIHTLEHGVELVEAGADLLGTSSAPQLLQALRRPAG